MTELNLYADQNTDFRTTMQIKDSFGSALDITGFTINAMARRGYLDTNPIPFDVSIANASQGAFYLTLPASTTLNMDAGRYIYDCVYTYPSSYPANTIMQGMSVKLCYGIFSLAPSMSLPSGMAPKGSTYYKQYNYTFTGQNRTGTFSITDAGVTPNSTIGINVHSINGLSTNESGVGSLLLSTSVSAGTIVVTANSLVGPLNGAYGFTYTVYNQ